MRLNGHDQGSIAVEQVVLRQQLLALVRGDSDEERRRYLDAWLYKEWPDDKSRQYVSAIATLGRCDENMLEDVLKNDLHKLGIEKVALFVVAARAARRPM